MPATLLKRDSSAGVILCIAYCNFSYQACNFIKKETLAQVFSCEFCEISRSTFFTVHLRATASLWIYVEFISVKFWNLRTAASDYSFVLVIYLFSRSLYNYEEKLWSFMVKKMYIEIRSCNPMTYDFKGHVKIIEIYMVKFNVSILNRLKIMGFFCKCKVYT